MHLEFQSPGFYFELVEDIVNGGEQLAAAGFAVVERGLLALVEWAAHLFQLGQKSLFSNKAILPA